MSKTIWLIALAAALSLTAGCNKAEAPPAPAAAPAPAVEKAAQAPAAPAAMSGEQIYTEVCSACHATGVSGAPKFGDKADWAEHIAEGVDHLVEVAIAGEGAMPPRGGKPTLTDDEVRAAVNYMVDHAR